MIATTLSAIALLPFISAKTYNVIVGGPGLLLFTPEYVAAQPGDSVRFTFLQKNHTATQSTFATPCAPLAGGFNSGFKPVPDTQVDSFPYYDVPVKDTAPAWFYCAQGTHCSAGMVFAINPPATGNTFQAFKSIAQGAAPPPASSAAPTSSAYGYPYPYPSSVAYSTPAATPSSVAPVPSPSAPAVVDHRVVVGGADGLVYKPNFVQAKKGDTVTFEFRQKNHTVTQSSFDNPCRKLEFTTSPAQVGFDSGFFPVGTDVTANFPTWTYTVEDDTKPLWAYCRQGNHCGQGMVFAINPTVTGKTFDDFLATAKRLNGTTGAAPSATASGSAAPTGTAASQAPNSAIGLSSGSFMASFMAVAGAIVMML